MSTNNYIQSDITSKVIFVHLTVEPMENSSHNTTVVTVTAEEETIRRIQELSMRDAANIERRIPTEQDFLIAYATFPGTFGFTIIDMYRRFVVRFDHKYVDAHWVMVGMVVVSFIESF